MKLILLLFTPFLMHAQPAFEVASIKPSNNLAGVEGGCHGVDSKRTPVPLGRCVITEGRLSHMIGIAWNVSMTNLKSEPDWIARGDARFNLEAKAEDPKTATEQQLLQMLQALLVERFKLKYHREDLEVSGYALMVGKNGAKLKESTADRMNFFGKPQGGRPVAMSMQKVSMRLLAEMISGYGPGPTVDKTGLTGEYDFTLNWDDSAGPSLFSALQEQLGLKLVGQKVTKSLFVVDSAEKPGPN
jgi:uncharacterized protein (TIGR03435 family)